MNRAWASFNPEFRRNLWVEFSLRRLVAMPAFLGLLFLGGHVVSGRIGVDQAALGGLVALLIIWGTRQAAGAVLDEVRAGTWDAQRMSAVGPFAMTWGKLLGATAYTWYGAAWCVAAMLWADLTPPGELLNMLLTALTAQTGALFLGLLLSRGVGRGTPRAGVGMAQGLAIILALWLGTQDWYWSSGSVLWFGRVLDARAFMLASQALALLWLLAGAQALIRSELRYPPEPWTWLAFLAFAATYCAGFGDALSISVWALLDLGLPLSTPPLLMALGCTAWLTLLAVVAGPHDSVTLRRWLAAPSAARGRPLGLLMEAPAWALGLLPTLGLAVAVTVSWGGAGAPPWMWGLVWSTVLLLVRDLGLVLALTLDAGPRRGPLGAVLLLVALHALIPAVLGEAFPSLVSALLPVVRGTGESAAALLAVLAQALAAWLLVAWRWRRAGLRPHGPAA
jgi:hypothetical protein